MDEKRSARRRKILENAEKRLNKVLGTQSSSGKPPEKPEQSQENVHHSDDGHKDMTADSEGLNIFARDLSLSEFDMQTVFRPVISGDCLVKTNNLFSYN